jgi:hypothetical protein
MVVAEAAAAAAADTGRLSSESSSVAEGERHLLLAAMEIRKADRQIDRGKETDRQRDRETER